MWGDGGGARNVPFFLPRTPPFLSHPWPAPPFCRALCHMAVEAGGGGLAAGHHSFPRYLPCELSRDLADADLISRDSSRALVAR